MVRDWWPSLETQTGFKGSGRHREVRSHPLFRFFSQSNKYALFSDLHHLLWTRRLLLEYLVFVILDGEIRIDKRRLDKRRPTVVALLTAAYSPFDYYSPGQQGNGPLLSSSLPNGLRNRNNR